MKSSRNPTQSLFYDYATASDELKRNQTKCPRQWHAVKRLMLGQTGKRRMASLGVSLNRLKLQNPILSHRVRSAMPEK